MSTTTTDPDTPAEDIPTAPPPDTRAPIAPPERDQTDAARARRVYTRAATLGAALPLLAAAYNIWSVLHDLGGFNPWIAAVPCAALEWAAFTTMLGARADSLAGREARSAQMYVLASLSGVIGSLHWFVERTGPGLSISSFTWNIGPTSILLGALSLIWPIVGAYLLHKAHVHESEAAAGTTRAQRREANRIRRIERHKRRMIHRWGQAREAWRELRRDTSASRRKIDAARQAAQDARDRALSAHWFIENLRPTYFPGMTIPEFEAAANELSEMFSAVDVHGAVLDRLGVPGEVAPLDAVRALEAPARQIEAANNDAPAAQLPAADSPRMLAAVPAPVDDDVPDGPKPVRWDRLTEDEKAELMTRMLELRDAGRTQEEIADALVNDGWKLSASTVSRRLADATPAAGFPLPEFAN